MLARGFEAAGLPLAPLPAAILTAPFRERAACQYDGWCDAGCPIGALANPLVTHLGAALRLGATLRTNAQATAILADARGRADGVRWVAHDGTEHVQPADVVVVAASTIQTPRLLLASAGPRWPDGPGNAQGLVGRGLMVDVVAQAAGLFEAPTECHLGVSAGQMIHRALPGDGRARPAGGYQWQVGPSLKPADIFGIAATRPMLFGRALHDFVQDASRHLATMVGMGEQRPDPANRILLASARDRFGMPLARIVHARDAGARALLGHMAREGEAIVRAAGARVAWSAELGGGHPAGGTPMGRSPEDSVTDSLGRVHDVPNLWLAGAGLLPTTAGTSPTFTILALAARAADTLLTRWRDYAR
jgi:choline dehydrogenase-like flavoprotein